MADDRRRQHEGRRGAVAVEGTPLRIVLLGARSAGDEKSDELVGRGVEAAGEAEPVSQLASGRLQMPIEAEHSGDGWAAASAHTVAKPTVPATGPPSRFLACLLRPESLSRGVSRAVQKPPS